MQSLWRSTTAPARCQSGLVRPLLITGPPAAGKSATARALAGLLPLAAVIDVDDLRQLVVAGHAAPWDGESGLVHQLMERGALPEGNVAVLINAPERGLTDLP